MADGSRHALYYVKEQVSNITPTNPALSTLRITGCTLGLDKDDLQSDEIRSDRQIADSRQGANQIAGDINFELSYGTFDELIQGVLQAAGWSTDTPSAGTDQIQTGTNRSSFTFIRHFSDITESDNPYHIFTGCEISSMQLSLPANGRVTGSFSIIGRGMRTAANLDSLSAVTYNPVTTTLSMDAFSGGISEGGSSISVITEASLTIQNGMGARFVVGSKESINPENGRSNVTGQISAYFENSNLIDKFLNEESSSISFELRDPQGNFILINLPRLNYSSAKPDVSGEGSIILPMPFQVTLDPTTNTNIQIQRTPVAPPTTP